MTLLLATALAQTTGGTAPPTSGQLYRPTVDGTHTLWTDDSGRAPDGAFLARAFAHYARDPVIYLQDGGDATRIVGDLFQLSLIGAYTRGPVRIGVDVPVFLRSIGDAGGESGLGDVAMDVKVTALDRAEAAVGLGVAGRATLPTATVQTALGYGGFAWELGAIVDKEVDRLLVAGNLGVKGVPRVDLENFDWRNQLVARVGGGYALTDRAGISLDVAGHVNLTDLTSDATPVEALVGGWGRVDDTVIRGGVGGGLTTGFGAPALRLVLGVGYEPPVVKDLDADGIVDRDDACPEVPEDADGFRDDDGCPEPTSVVLSATDPSGSPIPTASFRVVEADRSVSGVAPEVPLTGGTYTVEVSADGFDALAPQTLEVPDAERHAATWTLVKTIVPAKLTVDVHDPEGRPIAGATWTVKDVQGSHGAGSSASLMPGAYEVRAEAVGWRPATRRVALADAGVDRVVLQLQPAKVEITKERIDIKESVFFETGKAVIKPESFGLLDEVAQTILEHPELTRIRIEGHTDSRGSASSNLTLSRNRAASVRDYLMGKGVDAGRLESEGYGEGRPIAKGENEAAWSKNRRVDFFVVERSDATLPPGDAGE